MRLINQDLFMTRVPIRSLGSYLEVSGVSPQHFNLVFVVPDRVHTTSTLPLGPSSKPGEVVTRQTLSPSLSIRITVN